MIHAHFVGRVGRDAELKTTNSGDSLLKFVVAVDDGYGEKKTTQWVECALWGKRAATLQPMIHKGDKIAIHGSVKNENYQAKDGTTKTTMNCRVNEVDLLEPKGKTTESNQSARSNQQVDQEEFDDQVPF